MSLKKCFCAALLALALFFCGCDAAKRDYLRPLRGELSAQLEGTFCDVSFTARLSVTKREGAREATLTFYAPTALADTVLCYGASGMSMSVGSLTLGAPPSYEALLLPFLGEGEIHDVTAEGELTRVWADGYSLFFSADGAPVAVKSDCLDVRILSFSSE